jgi:hypothetical protein
MEITSRLDAVYAKIQKSETAHKKLLAERDQLAREAADAGLTWREIQAHLHLSPRGLSLVLERTK